MKITGCNCTICTRRRRTFVEVIFWLLLAVLIGLAVAGVFWK